MFFVRFYGFKCKTVNQNMKLYFIAWLIHFFLLCVFLDFLIWFLIEYFNDAEMYLIIFFNSVSANCETVNQ